MTIFNLLEGETQNNGNPWLNYVLIGVLLVAIVLMFVFSGRKNKQMQKEYMEQIAAIKPGNKVKSIGGICGIVVEVCEEDNTLIIETGSEKSGKSFIKLSKEQIAETDAKGSSQIAREAAEAMKKAEKPEEAQSETPAQESSEQEAQPAEEETDKENK